MNWDKNREVEVYKIQFSNRKISKISNLQLHSHPRGYKYISIRTQYSNTNGDKKRGRDRNAQDISKSYV